GAADLGDIGVHFPDTLSEFKGIDSKILLNRTSILLKEQGWEIGNIDAVVSLEKPKIMAHAQGMKEAIASSAGISVSQISIKATTGERLGFVGSEDGIIAHAVTLIHRD
ncbi:MAG: 2-C-methyl-D-erythritol 2,4-cyclodiphosphate synthase, partial [Crocinitomicaceae bacterium]|nr:2-C-methyl-D-erythritol 2,4-cyclodiphosphate synthase [Crocinitomicaceae bacterium]